METRLTVELVPSTCWYTNVRSDVPTAVLDRLCRRVAAEADQRCEVCGGGRRWPVECHEVWHYDDAMKVQGLDRLMALCPACHEVKHAGLASKRGRLAAVVKHLAAVNGWTTADAELYLEAAFEQWAARSRHPWTLDISVLTSRYAVPQTDLLPGQPGADLGLAPDAKGRCRAPDGPGLEWGGVQVRECAVGGPRLNRLRGHGGDGDGRFHRCGSRVSGVAAAGTSRHRLQGRPARRLRRRLRRRW